jgi:crotonobetainyl-CoA hydratase
MTSATEPVLVDRRDAVGIIHLNRPAALNAVDAHLATAVAAALDDLDSDATVRAVVITGVGRAFCAGADLKATSRGLDVLVPGHPEWGFVGLTGRILGKPVIAAVNGLALGGGAEIVLACDLAVMSEDAWLGLPEVTRGLFPGGGGAIRLPRQAPLKLAMEKLLTGEPISPQEALAWGLVNAVTSAADVLETAIALAGRIAANSPSGVRTTRDMALLATAHGSEWDRAVWAANEAHNREIPLTPDAVEGARAFVERRPPHWQP